MKILDKYILKRYLGSFFFIVMLSSMLSVVIDAAEKINDFLAEDGPTFYQVVFEYYLNFIPFLNSLIFPLYNLIAVVFFTSRLAANSEFIAMIGNGVNHYRLLVPYLLGASIIAGLHFYGNHNLIPESNKTRTLFENTYIYKHNFVGNTGNFHAAASPYEEFYLQGFNRYDSTGSLFAWIKHDSSRLKRTSVWTATKIRLLEPPNHWRLSGIKKREKVSAFKDEVITMPPQVTIDTTIGLYVTDLIKRDNHKDNMTTDELIVYINKQKAKGIGGTLVFEVERYRRSADPFSIFILTLIGFSIASRKMRGGMAWHLVVGFGLSAIYIFMTKFSTTFSINGGLSPFVGVWVPNFFFMGVAIWMLFRAQK
ncbi:LptF/LptG family permease [Aureispira anguillae]|uniref:LptF/LptG family permease n=1 Tax=Aureispira anguillae TaxID=2864201 RepID=A0A915VMQ9_9BACT|nr:LptF/LptG family permease [Aureispira anguillae]BDS09549.1 LptF/LptG family permease [Aureispira anguillae]